jgi:hypothetical protein
MSQLVVRYQLYLDECTGDHALIEKRSAGYCVAITRR